MSNLPEISQTKSANFAILPAHHFYAIELRYQQTPYSKITEKIKEKYDIDINPNTVKWWFYKKGPLYSMYIDYAEQMIEMEMEETRHFIRGNLKKAAMTLARVMAGQGGPAQVAAANSFLDRGLGKAEESVKHSGSITIGIVDVLRLIKEANGDSMDGQSDQNDNQSAN